MRNKKYQKLFFFIIAFIFFNIAVVQNVLAVEDRQACQRSGGTWSESAGKCACPSPKQVLPSTGDCGEPQAAAENAITEGTPSQYVPLSETGGSVYNRPLFDSQAKSVKFNYQLLESFPGFFTKKQVMTDFPAFVSALYKFGVWTVGLAATFMLVIGGFMYMTSAGNNSRASSAKGVINDALIGLVVALAAYLLLYVINPDLVKLNPDLVSVEVKEFKPSQYGTGKCEPSNTELCSVEALRNYFDNQIKDPNIDANKWATEASSICNLESGGKELAESGTDFCQNDSVSMGLFQINISAHAIGGLTCNNAFNTPFVAGGRYKCKVINPSLYGQCMQKAKTASINLQKAWSLFKSSGYSWSQWGANTICKFPKGSTKK